MDTKLQCGVVILLFVNGLMVCNGQKTPRYDYRPRENAPRGTVPNYRYGIGNTERPNVTPRSFFEGNLLSGINDMLVCDISSGLQCNITSAERCVRVKGRSPHCLCLPGHVRSADGVSCIAVKSFRFQFPTLLSYDPQLGIRTSALYRKLEYQLKETLFKAIKSSDLDFITHDVVIRQLVLPKDGYASFDLELFVSRSYSPSAKMVQENLRRALKPFLRATGDAVFLHETNIVVDAQMTKSIEVTDPDACMDPLLNYCDEMALCVTSEKSFTCRCPESYIDASPDRFRFPGEKCLYRCHCANEGKCIMNQENQMICHCSNWWFGSSCEINGKALLIAFFLVFALFLVFGIALCTFCCCNNERKPPPSLEASDKSGSKSVESIPGALDVLYLQDPRLAPLAHREPMRPIGWRPHTIQHPDFYGTYDLPRIPMRAPLAALPQITYPVSEMDRSTRSRGHGSKLKRSQLTVVPGDFNL